MLRLSHLFIVVILTSIILFGFNMYIVMSNYQETYNEPSFPYFSGLSSNNGCSQYILPFGEKPDVSTDSQDMAFQMWINVGWYSDDIVPFMIIPIFD